MSRPLSMNQEQLENLAVFMSDLTAASRQNGLRAAGLFRVMDETGDWELALAWSSEIDAYVIEDRAGE